MKNIYFVGTPNKEKGIEEFHKLALEFKEHHFFWFCFKLGEGIEKMYPRIEFLVGFDNEAMKERIKQDMDAFVCCSHFEGFSLPIAEAMMLRKPVLAYALDEVVDVYDDCIEYVQPFDFDRMIVKLREIIDNNAYKKDLYKAEQYILDHYSPDKVTDKLLDIIL